MEIEKAIEMIALKEKEKVLLKCENKKEQNILRTTISCLKRKLIKDKKFIVDISKVGICLETIDNQHFVCLFYQDFKAYTIIDGKLVELQKEN